MTGIAVLGSGMAACGAAYRLLNEGAEFSVFDRGAQPGGHTKTYMYPGGWVFDDGPHVSFTKDIRIQQILSENIGGDYHAVPTGVNNYWQGYWIKHPAQCNLYGLPTELVVRCIEDFVVASQDHISDAANYAEWLVAAYGRSFAETFPYHYTRKIHCTDASNLTADWMGPRLYRPSLEEVLRGALSPATADVHYIDSFRYPNKGGFFSYLEPIYAKSDLRMDHEVTRIRPRSRQLEFANGDVVDYEGVVSSIPLPVLVPLIEDAPSAVLEASDALSFTGCAFVNIGIDREEQSEATWTYFYDEDISITRLSYPHRFSPDAVPPGCASFQCEVYFSPRYRPLAASRGELIEGAIRDLRTCGLLRSDDQVLLAEVVISPFANVIFDHDRRDALNIVHAFLTEVGIRYCGRFGEWDYLWTDQAFMSGEGAAQSVLDANR